jgi:hypothetical protein
MPSVTVQVPDLTAAATAEALTQQLGSGYKVVARDESKLRVSKGAMTYANVHLTQADGVTKVHVHGGGFLIGRALNELTIARRVADAVRQSPGLKGTS